MSLLPFREFLDGLLTDSPFSVNFHDVSGCFRRGSLTLSPYYLRHQAPLCHVAKRTEQGLKQCLAHKASTVQKLLQQRTPFWESCPCGMEEYVFPLFYQGQLLGIGYIGGRFVFTPSASQALQTASTAIGVPLSQLEEGAKHCTFPAAPQASVYPFAKRAHAQAIALAIQGHLERLTAQAPPKIPKDSRSFLDYAKEQAHRHYQKQLSISLLAGLYGLNGKYAGAYFKAQVGESFQVYINRIRIKNACHLLTQSDLSVLQIAYEVGFQSVPYFNRCFLRMIGISPGTYRRQQKEERKKGVSD